MIIEKFQSIYFKFNNKGELINISLSPDKKMTLVDIDEVGSKLLSKEGFIKIINDLEDLAKEAIKQGVQKEFCYAFNNSSWAHVVDSIMWHETDNENRWADLHFEIGRINDFI